MNESGVTVGKKVEERTVDDQGKPIMHIKVHSPFKTYFDGEAYSVSAENNTGPFDILPHHHRFMTLLNPCDLIIRPTHGEEERVRISGGLMHVKTDRVTIFLDI